MKVQTVKNRKLIWEFYTIDSEGNENIYSDWVGIKPARTKIWKLLNNILDRHSRTGIKTIGYRLSKQN
jgi:hypothetical protein